MRECWISPGEVLVGVGEDVQRDLSISVAQAHFVARPVAALEVELAAFFIDAERLSVLEFSDVHGASFRA